MMCETKMKSKIFGHLTASRTENVMHEKYAHTQPFHTVYA